MSSGPVSRALSLLTIWLMASLVRADDTFRFTVTADPRGQHAIFDSVLKQINTHVGGPGVFHVTVGDADDRIWENRAKIDADFGPNFPWYVAVGNHETEDGVEMQWVRNEYDNGNGIRTPLKYLTNQDGPTGTKRLTYTWDYGDAHFIVLNEYWNGGPNEASGQAINGSDTATDGDVVPALYAWLAADLDKTAKPYVFVFGHEPAYPYYRHVGDSLDRYPSRRDAFWALLESYGVQVYFVGHTHYYSKHQNSGGRVWQFDAGNAGNCDPNVEGQTFFDVVVAPTQAQVNVRRNGYTGGLVYSLTETITVLPVPKRATLTLTKINGSYGDVQLAPEPNDANLPQYRFGTPVTLTATPIAGKAFKQWEIYDPNYPGDVTYAAIDANNPITIMMNTDTQVGAVFKCGSGVEQMLPLLVMGAALCGFAYRRRRVTGSYSRR